MIHKPIPTMFNGVLYRSKSEARLAVCLTAWGSPFAYEPAKLKVNQWVPDFTTFLEEQLTVIEYKPTLPTEEYGRKLCRNFMYLRQLAAGRRQHVAFELWVVDFCNRRRQLFQHRWSQVASGNGKLCEIKRSFDFSFGEQFRFDLGNSADFLEESFFRPGGILFDGRKDQSK